MQCHKGDQLVFVVGGFVKSIHIIESNVYIGHEPLWPLKDGSNFPYRIKISAPLYSGDVSLPDIADQISFMNGKVAWGDTIQGHNGVFNPRLTDTDIEILKNHMQPVEAPPVRNIPKHDPITEDAKKRC
jgi:hypothetical protein